MIDRHKWGRRTGTFPSKPKISGSILFVKQVKLPCLFEFFDESRAIQCLTLIILQFMPVVGGLFKVN